MAHGIAIEDSIGRMDLRKRIPLLLDKVEQACGMGYFDGREQLVHRVHALIDALQRLPSDPPPRAVVHGDLNFRNFLVDEAGVLSGVIDWGDAHIGDPAVDLSIIFSFCPPAARPPFFEVYGAVSPEMELRARFRALYVSLMVLLYAHEIGQARQVRESLLGIANALDANAQSDSGLPHSD
jgi:Ser/Thr protein kinase RdoA (MazF antagonist)